MTCRCTTAAGFACIGHLLVLRSYQCQGLSVQAEGSDSWGAKRAVKLADDRDQLTETIDVDSASEDADVPAEGTDEAENDAEEASCSKV